MTMPDSPAVQQYRMQKLSEMITITIQTSFLGDTPTEIIGVPRQRHKTERRDTHAPNVPRGTAPSRVTWRACMLGGVLGSRPSIISLTALFLCLAVSYASASPFFAVGMHSTARHVQAQWRAFSVACAEAGVHSVYKSIQLECMGTMTCGEAHPKHKFRKSDYGDGPCKRATEYKLIGGESLTGFGLYEKKLKECIHCGVSFSFKLIRKRLEDEVLNRRGTGMCSCAAVHSVRGQC
jgi:hypothetical protein